MITAPHQRRLRLRRRRPAHLMGTGATLAAFVLAAVLLFGMEAREAMREWRESVPQLRELPRGTREGAMSGARWRLVQMRRLAPSELARAIDPLPAGTQVVELRFSVTPLSSSSPRRITGCGFRLRDGDGRRWNSAVNVPYGVVEEENASCMGESGKGLPVGISSEVTAAVLLPAGAGALRPSVVTRRRPRGEQELVFAAQPPRTNAG